METRTLGRTGIPVSHVGFGTGGYNAFGQSVLPLRWLLVFVNAL